MKHSKLATAIKLAMGASIAASAIPATTFAADEPNVVEEIVVTGSRIKRADLESVSPYNIVSGEEFKISGNLNVEQKLAELPSTLPSFGPSSNNPGDGTARVDLRGLGSFRTLVLVNGRRYIPATQTGVVDLNTVPGTLIKQVDVLTGGASAVYGSDAVAGVVNFVMIDDFEGVEFTGLYDITSEGDAEKYNMDVTIGGNFADGRGNAVAYLSYAKREALYQGDRSFSDKALTESGDTLVGGGSSGVPGTRIFGGPAGVGTFDSAGNPLPWVEPSSRFNYAPDNFLQLPQERYLIASFAHFDMTENLRVYAETQFAHNKVPQELAPTPAFTTVEVNPDSPFFSPEAQAALDGSRSDTNGDGVIDGDDNAVFFIGRRMVENGSRQAIDTRDAFRVLLGASGNFNDDWSFDAYYSKANLENSNLLNNDVSASRFIQAVAVTDDGLSCQDPSGGCVPINIWGPGNISQEAIDYVKVGASNVTSIDQEVIQASVTGNLVSLPGASYPVAVVFGYEHRQDKSSFRPDQFLSGGDVLGFNAGDPTVGSYKVSEFFTELNVPILEGKDFAEDLTFWAAARASDYSNVGNVTSYATALNWAPTESVKFRIGYQEAVRAPNVFELFQGSANGFPGADDPCSIGGYKQGETSDQLCNTVGGGLGPLTVNGFTQSNTQIEGRFGGNANLSEETSNTFTVGAVLNPIDGLDISIDYYEIEIEDAISVLGGGVNNVLDLCYNKIQDASSAFCQAIQRRDNGQIEVVNVLNANIGKLETSGVDLNINYTTDFDWGIGNNGSTLSIQFTSTFLDKFDNTPIAARPDEKDVCAGDFGNTCGSPLTEVLWNTRATLTTGDWTFSGLLRYIGEAHDDQIDTTLVTDPDTGEQVQAFPASNLVVPSIDEEYYLDLTVGYQFSENMSANFGVKNVLDTEPTPLGDSQEQANTFPSTYDLMGPRYFVSFSYKM